jgi:hypothetical protein
MILTNERSGLKNGMPLQQYQRGSQYTIEKAYIGYEQYSFILPISLSLFFFFFFIIIIIIIIILMALHARRLPQ